MTVIGATATAAAAASDKRIADSIASRSSRKIDSLILSKVATQQTADVPNIIRTIFKGWLVV
jgi:hypothetical protein